MRRILLIAIFIFAHFVFSQTSTAQTGTAQKPNWEALNPEKISPGLNEIKHKHGSELRRLVIVAPKAFDKNKSYPVLYCFHGAGGKADKQIARWRRHVDKHNLILIGVDAVQSLKKWNFKDNFHAVNHDDVGLICEVTHALIANRLADSKAIYTTGHSSGGLFCYRLAKETSLFAAVCPMSCGMAKDAHDPDENTRRVHLLQVIGDQDKSYHGTTNPKITMYSADKRIEIWRTFNGCNTQPVTKIYNKELTLKTYTSRAGIEVAICEAKQQGHHLRLDLRDSADNIALDFMLSHRKDE
ncbi:MAG: hypothetical protein P8J27_10690 [Mariniblastus sp.]|nr:hypothetical protein [Mariniblastus sp.]